MVTHRVTIVFDHEMHNYNIDCDLLSANIIEQGDNQYLFMIVFMELKCFTPETFFAKCNDLKIINAIIEMQDNDRKKAIADYVMFKEGKNISKWLIEVVQD